MKRYLFDKINTIDALWRAIMKTSTKPLRVLTVENDPVQRFVLKELIELYCPSLNIVGESSTTAEAASFLDSNTVDVLFLDVMLRDNTVFELLKSLNPQQYLMVFATAHRSFAIDSINQYTPAAYLVKPFNQNDLVEAEKRLLQLTTQRNAKANVQTQKLLIRHNSGQTVVEMNDVLYLKADQSYTTFVKSNGEKIITSRNIRYFEEKLDRSFLRVHRSYVVNLKLIAGLFTNDVSYVSFKNNQRIPVSRRLLKSLKAHLDEAQTL